MRHANAKHSPSARFKAILSILFYSHNHQGTGSIRVRDSDQLKATYWGYILECGLWVILIIIQYPNFCTILSLSQLCRILELWNVILCYLWKISRYLPLYTLNNSTFQISQLFCCSNLELKSYSMEEFSSDIYPICCQNKLYFNYLIPTIQSCCNGKLKNIRDRIKILN